MRDLLRRSAVVCSLAGLCLTASPALSETWKQISPDRNKLYFALNLPKRHALKDWNASFSRRVFRLTVAQNRKQDRAGELYYYELAPNYYFDKTPSFDEFLAMLPFLRDGYEATGDPEAFGPGPFRLNYQKIRKNSRECVGFSGKGGQGGGDAQLSEGTSFLLGYYCAPKGDPLKSSEVQVALGAIGLKAEGELAPRNREFAAD